MSDDHGPSYFKTYVTLMILMFVSLIGSEIGKASDLIAVTLISAWDYFKRYGSSLRAKPAAA